ncbi:MAG: methylmalonyl Co-A mutase-associated GTPase MeaB [Acidimicrobiales bacterium]|nr:methylmalonyl Co-A mutase-associated GTPase MeaB [Acidimicrobiales bacterium]
MTAPLSTEALADRVRAGDRRALARAITLVESTRADHRAHADDLLGRLLDGTGGAVRMGISGAPGAGKSTFIEAFGLQLVDAGHRVAVLAVDPSSTRSGGSILGDKTRMGELANRPEAFIRPSPSRGSLGGVARRTREALLLCEAAGFDVVVVETVGVGQSEIAVSDLVDLMALLVTPAGGDELQGIKRGIMEVADLVVVNKADGELAAAARHAAADYRTALHLIRPRTPAWTPRVEVVSAIERRGIAQVWDAALEHRAALAGSGELTALRSRQATTWLWSELTDRLLDELRASPAVRGRLHRLEAEVAKGRTTPSAAASALLAAFHAGDSDP